MNKHEFNKIASWVVIPILLKKEFKYFVTLTIKSSLLLEGKDIGYLNNFNKITNDRNEYIQFIQKENNLLLIESSYVNKKTEETGDKFSLNKVLLKKENIYFAHECLVKLLKKLEITYKDINYVWSFEISDVCHFNILLSGGEIELIKLRGFLRKEWNTILNVYDIPSTECDNIYDLKASLNYIFKLPLKIGFDESIYSEINCFRNDYEYKFGLEFFYLVVNKIIIFEKCKKIEKMFIFNDHKNSEKQQHRLELLYLERSLKRQKNTKHFFNYFGRLLKKQVYPEFIDYLNKLIKGLHKEKDIISHFIVSRVWIDSKLNTRIIYKFLISIFTLFYVHSASNIKRNKLYFYNQIGKIYYYGVAKKIHDEILEKLKNLYPDFSSKQTYELLYKNTGMYFMTFFTMFDFLVVNELADNMISINFIENEDIEEYKIKKYKLYSQNFPLLVKPKNWDSKITDLNLNCTGGLLNNGINFNIPLGKGNQRILKSNTGKVIDCVNYLQSISYEIDCMLFDYITYNKDKIKQNNILLNINEVLDNDFIKSQKEKSFNSKLMVFDATLGVLNMFKDINCFYFIYQIDFRGRIYVVSDYLNYQTNKLVRAIIRYNKKQLINKNSEVINWLKVVTVRKFLGSTKESFNWFVNYFDENLEVLIKDWIFNRTDVNEFFWLKADEPYYFLSLLFEWFRFFTSDNNYYSGFIVFFDATCSGSQIISLLLGCDKYAESLNINISSVNTKIQDYYMFVVQEFLDYCELNCKNKSFYSELLKTYDHNTLRKFFKKIIMTINYGLTKKGMKFKFKEQLVEMNKLDDWSSYNIDQFINLFYSFLENLVLVKSLNILIGYISFLIKNNRDFIVYTSFDGFTFDKKNSDLMIGLNYNKKDYFKYSYSLSKNYKRKRKQMSLVFFNKERNKEKEIRAFKANYVHHIDSIIVYSLINNIESCNIDISTIHDCFGIKLNDIDSFNQQYRNVLIKLFSEEHNFLNWLKYLFKKDISDVELLNALLKELELLRFNRNNSIIINVKQSFYIVFP